MRTGRNTNRRTKRNESRIFQGGVPVRDRGHSSNQTGKGGETREAYYLPQGCVAITPGAVALRKVTDIATLHYLKKGETQFLYELDNCGKYIPLTVKVPVREFAEELKRRGR
jgi:hypothetical protein